MIDVPACAIFLARHDPDRRRLGDQGNLLQRRDSRGEALQFGLAGRAITLGQLAIAGITDRRGHQQTLIGLNAREADLRGKLDAVTP